MIAAMSLGAVVLLAIVLLAAGMVLAAVVTFIMARMLLSPARMTDGKAAYVLQRLSPGDLGMHFQVKSLHVRDQRSGQQLKMAAWWIPHPAKSEQTVVLIHGYADAKVGAIAWAPMWKELGFNILAIDLRAHGESEGRYTTAGYFERHDLNQALDEFLAVHADSARRLVCFGISLGAAVVLAAARVRETEDIHAIILECPFADYARAALQHGKMMNMPAPILQRAAIHLAQWISGARFAEVRPVDMLADVRCPVLLIQSTDDPFVPDDDKMKLTEAIHRRQDAGHREFSISGAGHVMGICAASEAYQQRIADFLASTVSATIPAR
jgi:alpha-beta hydrolase superfamily lysophospholipase